uniref:Dachsous cadherin-related 2 n=1 Tax=Maylandia zebra TaxID=106582 RepID=A0A3P9BH59_9CICH
YALTALAVCLVSLSIRYFSDNINDNIPSFTRKNYHASISEGLPAGAEVLRVSASDPDEGSNGEVTYSLTDDNSQGAFLIDAFTGAIRTTRSLDRESRAQYSLRAVATDGCTQGPLSSLASVTIQVEDKRFCLELVLCNALDRETTESYALTVSVSDRGMPPLNSSTVVIVTVTDCNDNVPVFSSTEYHAQVSENSQLGTKLVQVSAHDPDLGTNGLVRYDIISGNSKGHLKLDPQSGLLVVNNSLDYEKDSKYILTIRASDGGKSSENHKVAFTIVFIAVKCRYMSYQYTRLGQNM